MESMAYIVVDARAIAMAVIIVGVHDRDDLMTKL